VRVSTPVSDLGDYHLKIAPHALTPSRERFSDHSRLVPAIGVFGETRALDTHDAEALAGRRFHHHPALKPICDLGAQLLQPRDFGGISSVSMSMWTRLSCSTRWISTIGSSGGVSSMR
jgi:hypothetical protein